MPNYSAEPEIEVDECTAAAIQRGIQAADDGQVVSSEEVHDLVRQWISEFSTPNLRQPTCDRFLKPI